MFCTSIFNVNNEKWTKFKNIYTSMYNFHNIYRPNSGWNSLCTNTYQRLMLNNWITILDLKPLLNWIITCKHSHQINLPQQNNKGRKLYTFQCAFFYTDSWFWFVGSIYLYMGGCRGHDGMVVGFTATYVIGPYHH